MNSPAFLNSVAFVVVLIMVGLQFRQDMIKQGSWKGVLKSYLKILVIGAALAMILIWAVSAILK